MNSFNIHRITESLFIITMMILAVLSLERNGILQPSVTNTINIKQKKSVKNKPSKIKKKSYYNKKAKKIPTYKKKNIKIKNPNDTSSEKKTLKASKKNEYKPKETEEKDYYYDDEENQRAPTIDEFMNNEE